MDMGTHTYGYGPGVDPDAAYRAAVARDSLPTVAEYNAAYPMEIAPDGAVIPLTLAGRPEGWVGDRSHVEGGSERLRLLFARMQEHSDAVSEAIRTGTDRKSLASRAVAMRNLWDKIITELEQ